MDSSPQCFLCPDTLSSITGIWRTVQFENMIWSKKKKNKTHNTRVHQGCTASASHFVGKVLSWRQQKESKVDFIVSLTQFLKDGWVWSWAAMPRTKMTTGGEKKNQNMERRIKGTLEKLTCFWRWDIFFDLTTDGEIRCGEKISLWKRRRHKKKSAWSCSPTRVHARPQTGTQTKSKIKQIS